VVAEARARITDRVVPDDILVARVRATLGHYCSHPRALDVTAQDGRVTLRGPILAHEADRLVSAVRRVRGVKDVAAELELHDRPNGVPALQGGAPRSGRGWLQGNWSPTTRVLAGGAGLAMLGYCLSRPADAKAEVCGWLGAGLLARAGTNMDFNRLLGIGAGHRAVES
jgi:hypothetical protein